MDSESVYDRERRSESRRKEDALGEDTRPSWKDDKRSARSAQN